ncbi:MAG TPA: mandelate racemase, partial [Rhodobiaceae bacterium]|nr:mandelate racemase [Rhodobiaceae bacterium]
FDALAEFNLDWLEEPIAADRPKQEWQHLKQAASMPIAAGENIQGEREFAIVINDNTLGVIQPDLAKWG